MTVISLGIMLNACTKFEDVGSGLVDDGKLQIITDTALDISFENIKRDSFIAFQNAEGGTYSPLQHLIARFQDPIFGEVQYELNAQLVPGNSYNFEGASFDSAFFYLAYDSNFAPYGNYEQQQTIDVYELQDEEIPNEIYTVDKFQKGSELLGTLTFYPNPTEEIVVDSSETLYPHIKIPLNEKFGEKILSLDTTVTNNVIDFLEEFQGLSITPREGSFDGGLLFTLNSNVTTIGGVELHYTVEDEQKTARLNFSSSVPHFTSINHNLEGSIAEDYLETPSVDPDYLFLQPGNIGVKLTFNDLSNYQGAIINNVELDWGIAGHPTDDTTIYLPAEHIFATTGDALGSRNVISDIGQYLSDNLYRTFFGGVRQENEAENGAKTSYKMNITHHFQRMVDGKVDNVIYIITTPQDVNRIRRSVIYGPGAEDPLLRPKIKVDYSTINE